MTAVTCAPSHRRLGLAAKLMSALEEISEKKHCFFVDLFVRVSNLVAINMYKALGYTIYRKVIFRCVMNDLYIFLIPYVAPRFLNYSVFSLRPCPYAFINLQQA